MDLKALESKIKSCSLGIKSIFFDKKNNRFFLEADRIDEKIKEFQEIGEIIEVYVGYKNFSSFNTFNVDILESLERLPFRIKTFKVKVRFISKIPISSKSIIKRVNTILKKDGLSFSEDSQDIVIYIEFDKDQNKNKKYLISLYKPQGLIKRVYRQDRLIVLCYPGSVIEISDFLRLSYVFKIPLVILSEKSSKFDFNLNKAKKMTKGIHYQDFPLRVTQSLPEGFFLLGFSKLASKEEKDLAFVLKKRQKIAFVFGDEKFGLSDYIRGKMDITVRLGDEDKKPLRASQALSYVLGFEVGLIRGERPKSLYIRSAF